MITTILKKENGIVNVIENPSQTVVDTEKSYCHLCWDCDNYDQCQKIIDYKKKSIENYPFIENGSQMIDSKGELQTFIVSKCNNYDRNLYPSKSSIDTKTIRAIREELRLAYFDVDTKEEADQKQYYLMEKGLLKNVYGKQPTNVKILKKTK